MSEYDMLLLATWGACGLTNRAVKTLLRDSGIGESKQAELFQEFVKRYPGRKGV